MVWMHWRARSASLPYNGVLRAVAPNRSPGAEPPVGAVCLKIEIHEIRKIYEIHCLKIEMHKVHDFHKNVTSA